jgi:type I restriction enzyme M protein
MSEELHQRGLLRTPAKIGSWRYYNIGATTIEALKKYGIILDRDYGEFKRRKPDGIVVDGKQPILLVEHKSVEQFRTPLLQKKAIEQELDLAKNLEAKILVATDTVRETRWINVANGEPITDANGTEIREMFDVSNERLLPLIQSILDSITPTNSRLRARETKNPTELAKQIWQDIWAVAGATPENCLYSFIELFIFKYLSDLGVLTGIYSFSTLIDQYATNSQEEVLETYASTVRPKIKELFPKNPKDNTTIINGTIFTSKDQKAVEGYSTVFRRILERFRDFGKLENIDRDFKSQVFESFLKESISKKNWGQYFTPLKVVRAIVKMADVHDGDSVCDPACGVGKFLLELVASDPSHYYTIEDGKIIPRVTLTGFDKGFDNEEQKTIILAKANMLIYLSDLVKHHRSLTKDFALLFNDTFSLLTNSILGTLAVRANERYDWILTNPPYVTSGTSNLKDEIKKSKLSDYYQINASGSEGLFMEWIIRALKPGGRAFVIVPDGIMMRNNLINLRKFIAEECSIEAIISLPTKTFFSTPKRTYILGLSKKRNKKDVQTEPIFTYLVSEIGESRDVYRFDIPEDHLTDAVNLYNQFKGAKRHFTATDIRCKVLPVAELTSNYNSWQIEKFWSGAEKQSLGIEEAASRISLQELADEFEGLKEFLGEAISDLKDLYTDRPGDVRFEEISVFDKSFFEMTRGKRITKKTIDSHKGTIPVYSSSKDETSVLGNIAEKYLKDEGLVLFESPALLFNIDGSVGKCFVRNDKKFSFIDVVGALRPLRDDLSLEYLKYELEGQIAKTGADYQTKLYFHKMREYGIIVRIPFVNGKPDLDRQKEIEAKYRTVQSLREQLREKVDMVTRLNLGIE